MECIPQLYKPVRAGRGPRCWKQLCWWRQRAFLHKVSQNLVDNHLIFYAGDHPGFTATLWADRDIDVEYPFQALCPGHGLVALCGCFVFVFLSGAAFAAFGRRHIYPVFAVGREYAVEPGLVYSRFRHQGSQLGNEIQRLKDDVRCAIAVGRFELITDIP